jgi:acyl-CoA thioesterase FadM
VRLLGTIAVNRLRDVFVGESLVVVSWTLGAGTRSVRTASALLAPDGELIASAENVWVAPRRRF